MHRAMQKTQYTNMRGGKSEKKGKTRKYIRTALLLIQLLRLHKMYPMILFYCTPRCERWLSLVFNHCMNGRVCMCLCLCSRHVSFHKTVLGRECVCVSLTGAILRIFSISTLWRNISMCFGVVVVLVVLLHSSYMKSVLLVCAKCGCCCICCIGAKGYTSLVPRYRATVSIQTLL